MVRVTILNGAGGSQSSIIPQAQANLLVSAFSEWLDNPASTLRHVTIIVEAL